jgi:predicted permease
VEVLKEETRMAGRSRRNVNFRNCLLVGQVALTLVCLTTAALLLRSIQRAYAIDPGFQTDRLMIALTNPGQAGYDKPRTEQFYRDVRSRVSQTPGVISVSWASNLPMFGRLSRAISIEGQELRRRPESIRVIVNTVDLDYFATLNISLTQGRDFSEADLPDAAPVAMINDTMARRHFPDQSPLGKRFRFDGDSVARQIVGVVKTANYTSLGEEPQACVFLPLRQNFSDAMVLYVETQGDPAPILGLVQREMRSLDPQLDVSDIRTGAKIIDQSLFFARIGVGLLAVFGLLALSLACVGLYGIVAYLVSQRQHEIGLRVALGATQVSLLRLVLGQGMKLVAVGIAIGIIGSVLVGRGLAIFLFGLSPTDPISIFGASFVLATIALLACYLPARRASRMDPLVALREA